MNYFGLKEQNGHNRAALAKAGNGVRIGDLVAGSGSGGFSMEFSL